MGLRKNIWMICWALALAAGGCTGSRNGTLPANQTPTATQTNAQVEQSPAWAKVLAALNTWNKGDPTTAVDQISAAQRSGGNNIAFFLHAGDMLAQANVWPLAAVMYLNLKRIQPQNLPADQFNKIREAAYFSGADAQAARVFMLYSDPWLDLGRVRLEMRNGQADAATYEIQTVTSNASLLAQFPEALLVEAEVFIAEKELPKANADLDKLATYPNLPDWITQESSRLRALAQPGQS